MGPPPMDPWTRLYRALEHPPRASVEVADGRVGAALALVADPGDGDLEFVFTRRRDDLATHPGQISFPGGRVDPGETVTEAALREAREEVALDVDTVEVLGALPASYIPPSRFWFQVVVGRWHAPHRLEPAEDEVAEVLTARLSTLRDPATWRVVRLSALGDSWAWQLDERHLLWGATAMATARLLAILEPDWPGGTDPSDLPAEREARPWLSGERQVPRPGPPLLPGVAPSPVTAAPPAQSARLRDGAVRAAGDVVADAVGRMGVDGDILVVAGAGGTGAVGLAAARTLRQAGRDVHVALSVPPDKLREPARRALDGLGDVGVVDGRLPPAGLVIDALVGSGLTGPLAGPALDAVLALRHHLAPLLSVDLPSGLHPTEGLVGDCIAANLTVAVGGVSAGLLRPGLGPFVGDLYLASLDGALVRLVPAAEDAGAAQGGERWRE